MEFSQSYVQLILAVRSFKLRSTELVSHSQSVNLMVTALTAGCTTFRVLTPQPDLIKWKVITYKVTQVKEVVSVEIRTRLLILQLGL
jgi:NMD protein affecting ribosome stability and mRNA decay